MHIITRDSDGMPFSYSEGVYHVFDENGIGMFVFPDIEVYRIKDTIREVNKSGKTTNVYCPNVRTLGHNKNIWSYVEGKENLTQCNICGAKLIIDKRHVEVEEVRQK